MTVVDVIVLAGGPAPPPVVSAIGRPIWSLPIASDCSIIEGWMRIVRDALAGVSGMILGDAVVIVSKHEACGLGKLALESDSSIRLANELRPHRGTAGVIADEVWRRPNMGGGCILVVEASASPSVDVGALFRRRLLAGRDVIGRCIVGESGLRRFCGVALCDRSLFDLVPEVGFFDLKEQLLPEIGEAGGMIDAVEIADRARRIRTRTEWLDAIQAWCKFTAPRSDVAEGRGILRPGEREDRRVVSKSASISGATVVSSIVMDEAVVEPGALVARSVIGPGMRVRAGTRVIDAVLADSAAGEAVIRQSGPSVTASAASQ